MPTSFIKYSNLSDGSELEKQHKTTSEQACFPRITDSDPVLIACTLALDGRDCDQLIIMARMDDQVARATSACSGYSSPLQLFCRTFFASLSQGFVKAPDLDWRFAGALGIADCFSARRGK
jgi:hypothetical protein